MTDKKVVSWSEVEEAVRSLTSKISRGQFREIIGIARGGLIPAAMLAYELRIPIVRTILPHEETVFPHDVLLVDDIADNGCTLQYITGSTVTSVLFAKPLGRPWCKYWGAEVPQDIWLVFPWAPTDEVNR